MGFSLEDTKKLVAATIVALQAKKKISCQKCYYTY
jgi:hypothetical protein